MQLNSDVINRVTYLTGTAQHAVQLSEVPARMLFDERVIEFLGDISKELMSNKKAKIYSDVVTFAFWIRPSSILKIKDRFDFSDGIHLGKGVAFHIAPSNVPVNFAYSLVAGLLCGNANIVRVPSKLFPQVDLIINAINKVLESYHDMERYVLCVRYDRDKEVNDFFSDMADVRIIWGGDRTIEELRKSALRPRSGEVTFADRYSLAVIDSDTYIDIEDKDKVAEDFYNDTFFSDQNACTSPRVIIWTGNNIKRAKNIFWEREHNLVEKKYQFQPIQGVNKLTQAYIFAANHEAKIESSVDNLIVRISISNITEDLMSYRDNSGFFYEYECENISQIASLCNDKRCQTIAYIGNKDVLLPIITSGVKGIDRIVPMGKTMDFDLIWDGYNLPSMLTRTIAIS